MCCQYLLCLYYTHLNATRFIRVKAKYQQPQTQQITTQSPSQDQSVMSTSPQPQTPSTTVVSETNEVRIESVVAYRDAGTYECIAHNSVSNGATAASESESNTAHMSLDLEVECEFDS